MAARFTPEQHGAIYSAREKRAMWRAGLLHWKLDSNQLRAYRRIRAALGQPWARFTLKWARRTGKTYLLVLIMIEECLRKRSMQRALVWRYIIAASTGEALRGFVWPAVHAILADCPEDLAPSVHDLAGVVKFRRPRRATPYAIIVLSGCHDAKAVRRLRGTHADGIVIDEIGTLEDKPGLGVLRTTVLHPQLITTKGFSLAAGTPPDSAGHEAVGAFQVAQTTDAFERAAGRPGCYDECTLYDNPRLTPEDIEGYLAADAQQMGITPGEFRNSVAYLREWLAEIITDPTIAVLPEFTVQRADVTHPSTIVRASSADDVFRDAYTCMDIGASALDWMGLLYAHWSFSRQRLRIVGERLERPPVGTPELAAMIREDEARYHGTRWEEARNSRGELCWREAGRKVFQRIADNNNPILLNDLGAISGVYFAPTAKDDLRAQVANVRRWIGEGLLEIDPSCVHLRAQMLSATWQRRGHEWTRTEAHGHFDLVAALVYLVRNVLPHINRVPDAYGLHSDTHAITPRPQNADRLVSLFE